MSTDLATVRSLTDKVFIGGDIAAIQDLVGSDFVSHDPPPGVSPDRAGLTALASAVVDALSGRRLEFDEIVETVDGRVVENWLMVATHDKEVFGLPPSGQEVSVRGIEIWRCADGQIVEHWGAVDMGDLVEKSMAAQG
jgi:predicted SnoaL-like aldol condensation-catalyzing enzyme